MALTYDWQQTFYPFVEEVVLIAFRHDLSENDGEYGEAVNKKLCQLIEAIEECSSFDPDKQIGKIVRELTETKTMRHVQEWERMGTNG